MPATSSGRPAPRRVRRRVCATALATVLQWLAAGTAAAGHVTIFAASSLTDALEEIAAAWRESGGSEVRFSFAASSLLARQIEQGAPADIFCSADREWMDHLEQRSLLAAGSRRSFLGNRLVIIEPAPGADAPPSAPAPLITAAFDIGARLGDGRLAVADPAHVPAGRYAQQALTSVGLWERVRERLAPSQNVRAALAMVEQGQVPLAVVYATDAAASGKVRVAAAFAEDSHAPIEYPMARVAGRDGKAARDLFDFLAAEPARAIFRRHGFTLR